MFFYMPEKERWLPVAHGPLIELYLLVNYIYSREEVLRYFHIPSIPVWVNTMISLNTVRIIMEQPNPPQLQVRDKEGRVKMESPGAKGWHFPPQ